MDSVGVVALLLVGLQRPVDGLLRVDGLLDALPAYGGEPEPEGFCLRRGDGLDDAQDALGIGGLHLSLFAVRGEHLNRGTNCTPVGRQLRIAGAHLLDVLLEVYDGTTAATLDCSRAVLEGRLEGDDLTVAAAGVFRQADAGREKALVVDLSITLTGKDKDNYVIDDANSQRDTSAYITPATLIVTPDADQSKVFASAEPALTYTVSGAANGEIPVFTGALARAEGENVGTYAITPGSLALKSGGSFRADNYDWKLSDAVVRFTISKAPAPVLKDIAVSQTYTMTAGTVRLSGQMPSDAGTLTYTPGNAGTTGFVAVSSWRVDADTAEVSYTLSDGAAGDTVTLPVTLSSANYEDAVVHLSLIHI